MSGAGERPVLIAGGGIGGLTAAIAFGRQGLPVHLFERSAAFREIGAGLQLSPNATRILRDLGVLERLLPVAVRPPAIRMRGARSFRDVAQFPLGDWAERRWGAPYLVAHRADLQQALLDAAASLGAVTVTTSASVLALEDDGDGAAARIDRAGATETVTGRLGVVADGVWSRLRGQPASRPATRFTGQIAWRRVIAAGGPADALVPDLSVGAYLSPGFHLVAYPIAGGSRINIVAFTKGRAIAEDWSASADPAPLLEQLENAAPALARLAADLGRWNAFPIHVVSPQPRWASGNVTLIGDAAHAMTPFAAQGAAMAIEDAWSLAQTVGGGTGRGNALRGWETERRSRVARVRRRGAFNKGVWHAGGPVAFARNIALNFASPERLAADLDWLYGYRVA